MITMAWWKPGKENSFKKYYKYRGRRDYSALGS